MGSYPGWAWHGLENRWTAKVVRVRFCYLPATLNIDMDYSTIAYSKLNLEYDRDTFIKEYDEFILPHTKQICNSFHVIEKTASLNTVWKMVPDDIYKNIVAGDFDANGRYITHVENRLPTWQMEQLMYVKPEGIAEAVLRGSANGYGGGTALRNSAYEKEWFVKPQYENLEIVKFIKNLPFKKIIFMHCVSLESGQFAGIHRDAKGSAPDDFTNVDNFLSRLGYVVLTLNISDGGVPLYWALDGKPRLTPMYANEPAYIISDYFLHGVPLTTSRRRQIRITGIPNDDFAKLLDMDTAVTIPADYKYYSKLLAG
jgi:hypothetical protein